MAEVSNLYLEQTALRSHGILGRSGPYGNLLYAFEYALLPAEAKQVMEIIANCGQLLYPDHDGRIYGNKSKDLPGSGLYREFTVPTPGLNHRGARRLVVRENGLVFFTACHYDRVPGKVDSAAHASAIANIDEHWRNGFYLVTGTSPSLRQRIAKGVKHVHNSRLPVPISVA